MRYAVPAVLLMWLLLSVHARGGDAAGCPPPPWEKERAAQPAFDRWFEDETIRLDYEHAGTSAEETVTLHALRREGPWPGSRTWLVDPTGFGKYRVEVRDAKAGTLLWSRGFCTLFGEWQTTDEASTVRKTFPETVRFPRPKGEARVSLHARGRDGTFKEIWTKDLAPKDLTNASQDAGLGVEVVLLNKEGPLATSLDIVIVPAGYPAAQEEKLRLDLARFAKILLHTPPFDRHGGGITLRGVVDLVDTAGPAEPRKGRNVAADGLRSTFDTLGSARYLNALGHWHLRDLAGAAPYDAIYVMVNTSRYGGAGIFNFYAVFPSDNEYDEYVFAHEFGHSFGGLGDEYYNSSVAYSDFYPKGVEPWEPNITALLGGREQMKWIDLVPAGTPVPTPEDDPWKEGVGVFEGAGYSAKGLYRPAFDCRMFSKRTIDFCPVCMCAVERMIRLYTQ